MYDTVLLERWDRNAVICHNLGILTSIVINGLSGKSKVKPFPLTHYHPYRKTEVPGHKIRPDNFNALLRIGDALAGG